MSTQQPVPRVIFWVIWFALLSGVLMIHFVIPGSRPVSDGDASPLWLVAVLPLAISALVRWLVLPKIPTAQAALPVFIIGMALAEAAAFAGIFIFPAHRMELVVLGILGIVQFMPLFAGRFGTDR
ncbi:MAG: hypothetical protein V4640_07910 [Verrucomicrobiota bacterium]